MKESVSPFSQRLSVKTTYRSLTGGALWAPFLTTFKVNLDRYPLAGGEGCGRHLLEYWISSKTCLKLGYITLQAASPSQEIQHSNKHLTLPKEVPPWQGWSSLGSQLFSITEL